MKTLTSASTLYGYYNPEAKWMSSDPAEGREETDRVKQVMRDWFRVVSP